MKVAIITPYYQPLDAIFRQCVDSVAAQTYACDHILVSDGHPHALAAERGLSEIRLPKAHGAGGNLPRCIGAAMAVNEGYEAIVFLDEDNWFTSDHVETMVRLHEETGAAICTAGRTIHRLDGSTMALTDTWSDGVKNTDTSCMFITRPGFPLLPLWSLMAPQLGPICDRIYWSTIKGRALSTAQAATPTVRFRSLYKVHYDILGEPAPEGAKTGDEINQSIAWLRSQPVKERSYWHSLFGIQ
ncbi:MAG: glycosyltransferase [Alphaproteobacteria bacterium]|nr:glycosyltransferase [Alphaproteobacteria bacterium]